MTAVEKEEGRRKFVFEDREEESFVIGMGGRQMFEFGERIMTLQRYNSGTHFVIQTPFGRPSPELEGDVHLDRIEYGEDKSWTYGKVLPGGEGLIKLVERDELGIEEELEVLKLKHNK